MGCRFILHCLFINLSCHPDLICCPTALSKPTLQLNKLGIYDGLQPPKEYERQYLSRNAQHNNSSIVDIQFSALLMEWNQCGILPRLGYLLHLPDFSQHSPQPVNHCLSSILSQFCHNFITPSCLAILQLVNCILHFLLHYFCCICCRLVFHTSSHLLTYSILYIEHSF